MVKAIYDGGISKRHWDVCCKDFAEAMTWGTDAEGYGSAVRYWDGDWHISSELPAIMFCPWCGEETHNNHAIEEKDNA